MFSNYFELRQLRKDNRSLARDIEYADDARKKAERELRDLKFEHDKLTAKLKKQETANTKLRDTIREQTAADLLVNALIGLGVVPKPTQNYDPFEEQKRLAGQQQLAGMVKPVRGNPALSGQNALGNIFGGIG